jgi:hypothetical protein
MDDVVVVVVMAVVIISDSTPELAADAPPASLSNK